MEWRGGERRGEDRRVKERRRDAEKMRRGKKDENSHRKRDEKWRNPSSYPSYPILSNLDRGWVFLINHPLKDTYLG